VLVLNQFLILLMDVHATFIDLVLIAKLDQDVLGVKLESVQIIVEDLMLVIANGGAITYPNLAILVLTLKDVLGVD